MKKSLLMSFSLLIFSFIFIWGIYELIVFTAINPGAETSFNDYAANYSLVCKMLESDKTIANKKIAFLTFDDGPSITVTPKILDILKAENVKATFFLLGKNIEDTDTSKKLVKRIYEEGHSIGNHTYSHNLKTLYPNRRIDINAYLSEIDKTEKCIKAILGNNYRTTLIRMPGGIMSRQFYKDPNINRFNEILSSKGISNVDWNATISDAEGGKKSANDLLNSLKYSVGNQNSVVILMHDTYGKEETAKALPSIVRYLKDNNFEFRVIN